jgi:hypothetical protein
MQAFLAIALVLGASSVAAIDLLKPAEISGQIAKLSTIYRCERGSWPSSVDLVRAVEAGVVAASREPSAVPWSSISSAAFQTTSDESLLIRLVLEPDASVFGCHSSGAEVTILVSNPECESYQSGLSVTCGHATVVE